MGNIVTLLIALMLVGCGKDEQTTVTVTETIRQYVDKGSLESYIQSYIQQRPGFLPPPKPIKSFGYKPLPAGVCGPNVAIGCCTGDKEIWVDPSAIGTGDLLKAVVWHEAAHCMDDQVHSNHPTMRPTMEEDAYNNGVRHPLDEVKQ